MNKQETIKPSPQFFSFVNGFVTEEVASESDSEDKQDYWLKMKTELEITGYPIEMIGRTIKHCIEQKLWETKYEKLDVPRDEYRWHSGHFYRWCRKAHLKQLHANSNTPPRDTSINTPNPNSLELLEAVQEMISIAIRKVKVTPGIDDGLDGEYLEQMSTVTEIITSCFDEKTKVPMNVEQVLLVCAASHQSVFDSALQFFKIRLELLTELKKILDKKQITSYQKNDIKDQLSLLSPDSRDTAIFQNYFGLQCESCDSWRVRKKQTVSEDGRNLICKACEHTFFGKTVNRCTYCQIPLFKENLLDMITAHDQDVKNEKECAVYACTDCGTPNNLPQEIIEYAQS